MREPQAVTPARPPRRRPVPRLRRVGRALACAAAWGLVALLPGVRVAAGPLAGELRERPAASWWLVPHQAPPVVRVVGGEGGAHCAEDGGACVVWAQGDWSLVEADGVWLAGRVYMPQVIR